MSLYDVVGAVTYHGKGDMMFLNGSDTSTVNDKGSGLAIHFNAGSDGSQLTIANFDHAGLIDFAPGHGGFTSVADVMSHLQSDGAGGMVLSSAAGAGSSPLIHFVGSPTSRPPTSQSARRPRCSAIPAASQGAPGLLAP